MEIKKVINKGEILNAEQLAQVTGGAGAKANLNEFENCKCEGTGDNTNKGKGCSCTNPPPDPPIYINGGKICMDPIDKPANVNPSAC